MTNDRWQELYGVWRFRGYARVALVPFLFLTSADAVSEVREAVSITRFIENPPDIEAPRIAPGSSAPIVALGPAPAASLAALAKHNRKDFPKQNGFERPFDAPIEVRLHGDMMKTMPLAGAAHAIIDDRLIWSAAVAIKDAHAMRLRLDVDHLPRETSLWAFSETDKIGPLDLSTLHEGTMWLPPIKGDLVRFELAIPLAFLESDEARFQLPSVLEIVDPKGDLGLIPLACEVDATCALARYVFSIDATNATAQLSFVKDGRGSVCSGTLINPNGPFEKPLLLTANHCLSTQAVAATLAADFDFQTLSCGQFITPPASEVNGSTLLATSAMSDFTLLELSEEPAGNTTYLGWTTAALIDGERLYRYSHPGGRRMAYSESQVDTSPEFCRNASSRLCSDPGPIGATEGGSSGSGVLNDLGQIVGQLFGISHQVAWSGDRCDYDSGYEVSDGAFRDTYPQIVQWIDPTRFGPDLGVSIDEVAPTEVIVGQNFDIAFTVSNEGFRSAPGSTVGVYQSDNGFISRFTQPLATLAIDPLDFGESIALGDGDMPGIEGLSFDESGTRFVAVCLQESVPGDLDLTNECSESIQITISEPGVSDFIVTGPSLPSDSLPAGGNVEFEATVTNQGDGASNQTPSLNIYASGNSTVNTADTFVGSRNVGAIPAGESRRVSVPITLPENAGIVFLGGCVDPNFIPESVTNNNCSTSVLVNLVDEVPDLIFWDLQVQPTEFVSGEPVTFTFTARNEGLLASPPSTVRAYLSPNFLVGPLGGDEELGSTGIGGLEPGESAEVTFEAIVNGSGEPFLGACVDAAPGEERVFNQCSRGTRVTIFQPAQLTFENLTVDRSSVLMNENVLIRVTIRNDGDLASDATELTFRTSLDAIVDADDPVLSADSLASINAGEARSTSTSTAFGTTGAFFVGACIAHAEGDVCSDAVKVDVNVSVSPKLEVILEGSGTGSVISEPAGIDCSESCSSRFAVDTAIALTATPSSDSVFAGWSGACDASGRIDLVRDSNCTVTFALADNEVVLESGFERSEINQGLKAFEVAHWAFEGDAGDSTGNGNDGLFSSTPAFGAGAVGQALDLRNSTNSMAIETPALDRLLACTISAWIRVDELVPDESDPCCGAIFTEDSFPSGAIHFNIAFFATPTAIEWGTGSAPRTPGPQVIPGAWTHYAWTYDSIKGIRQVFVNGERTYSDVIESGPACGVGSASTIGAWDQNGQGEETRFLNGLVDEFRIYSTALQADQVAVLSASGQPPE